MSSSVILHPRQPTGSTASSITSGLPQLLQTPSGLALLELQGAINFSEHSTSETGAEPLRIGRLDFPEYSPDALDPGEHPVDEARVSVRGATPSA